MPLRFWEFFSGGGISGQGLTLEARAEETPGVQEVQEIREVQEEAPGVKEASDVQEGQETQEAPSIVDISVIVQGAGISARCEFAGYRTGSGYTLDLYLRRAGEEGAAANIARRKILPSPEGTGVEMTDEVSVEPGIYQAAIVVDRIDGGPLQVDNLRHSLLYDVVKEGEGYVVTPHPDKEEEPDSPAAGDEGEGNKQGVRPQASVRSEEIRQEGAFWPEPSSGNGEENGEDGEEGFCTHSPEYRVVEAASPEQDALIAGECAQCGEVISYSYLPNSAYAAFLEEAALRIRNARDGQALIETGRWESFNQSVFDAMEERPDVTVVIRYRYNGKGYEVAIPAGAEVNSLVDENGFCGFRYLDQIFSGKK